MAKGISPGEDKGKSFDQRVVLSDISKLIQDKAESTNEFSHINESYELLRYPEEGFIVCLLEPTMNPSEIALQLYEANHRSVGSPIARPYSPLKTRPYDFLSINSRDVPFQKGKKPEPELPVLFVFNGFLDSGVTDIEEAVARLQSGLLYYLPAVDGNLKPAGHEILLHGVKVSKSKIEIDNGFKYTFLTKRRRKHVKGPKLRELIDLDKTRMSELRRTSLGQAYKYFEAEQGYVVDLKPR
jgi:hypothetical protein